MLWTISLVAGGLCLLVVVLLAAFVRIATGGRRARSERRGAMVCL